MKRTLFALAAALALAPSLVSASPIYVAGNTCPTDAQMSGYDRQYRVTDAIACVFDPASSNIQGDADDLALYFGGAGWAALGQEVNGGANIDGFQYFSDAGNDDGFFDITQPLTGLYNQFAVGVKDGGSPKWAIFLLSIGDFNSDWHFDTAGGDLSHFTLYGRVSGSPDPQCAPPLICGGGNDDPPTTVPDGGATMALMGASMGLLGLVRRKLQ